MKKSRRAKRTIRLLALWVGLATLAGSTLSFFSFFDYIQAARGYDDAVTAYRHAGLPWAPQDLHLPTIKPEDNAAPILRQALRTVTSAFPGQQTKVTELLKKQDYKRLSKITDSYKNELRLGVLATEKPKLDFHRDLSLGVSLLTPEVPQVKSLVRRFVLRAEVKAGLGDGKGAVQDITAAWKLSRLLGQDLFIFPLLVATNCESLTIRAIQRCAVLLQNDLSSIRALSELLRDYRRVDLAGPIMTSHYMALTSIRAMKRSDIALWLYEDRDEGFWASLDKSADNMFSPELKIGAYKTRYVEDLAVLGPLIRRYASDPRLMARRLDEIVKRSQKKKGKSYRISDVHLTYELVANAVVRQEAEALTTYALLSALAHKIEKGTFPKTIGELPGKWIDPYDRRFLRLRVTGATIRIYSVGPNEVDDGGTLRMESSNSKVTDDVSAIFPHPTMRALP
jgi:hypothetical protein